VIEWHGDKIAHEKRQAEGQGMGLHIFSQILSTIKMDLGDKNREVFKRVIREIFLINFLNFNLGAVIEELLHFSSGYENCNRVRAHNELR
jgi:hypothetical protein